MSHENTSSEVGGSSYELRVIRVKCAETLKVRLLSHELKGCFTHFIKDFSRYCAGYDCNPADHRTQRFWKGYAAVQVYMPTGSLWMPAILEVTENLELDFRGKWRRGSVWELSRARRTTKKWPPIVGVKISETCPDPLPEPFDLLPNLLRLFQVEQIALDQVNPLPPRTWVKATIATPPPGAQSREPGPQEILSSDEVMKMTDALRKRISKQGWQSNN
jgi:hypothetical protein